jgi:hypothetical protein
VAVSDATVAMCSPMCVLQWFRTMVGHKRGSKSSPPAW